VEHWVDTQLVPPVETVLLMPQLIFEAEFWLVVNRKILRMKSKMSSGIVGTKMEGWSRIGCGALGGDQTCPAR